MPSPKLSTKLCATLAAGVFAALAATTFAAHEQTAQAAFAAENDAAMAKMMSGMDVKPSGDIDRDFAAMMIAHHQGAIEMAQAELRFGSNEQLRRLAQEIVIEQQQEISVMHLALDHPLPPLPQVLTHESLLLPVVATAYCPYYLRDTD